MKNPYKQNFKWYFFDESFDVHGPFKTENEAKQALKRYLIHLG